MRAVLRNVNSLRFLSCVWTRGRKQWHIASLRQAAINIMWDISPREIFLSVHLKLHSEVCPWECEVGPQGSCTLGVLTSFKSDKCELVCMCVYMRYQEPTDLNMFDVFNGLHLFFYWCSVIPYMTSRNLFKLAPVSFWHDPGSGWRHHGYVVWQEIAGFSYALFAWDWYQVISLRSPGFF